jgi:hypothetical protein
MVILTGLLFSLSVSAGEVEPADRLADLTRPPDSWVALEAPQTAAGEQLFTVINGGAVLYMQAGFSRAAFASYRSAAGRDINLEIYRMQTADAARNVYKQKISAQGRSVDIGGAAFFEDYFLNFYRGVYQVTISGYASDRQTADDIFTIARIIDERLATP